MQLDLPKVNLQRWTKVKSKQCKKLRYPKTIFQDERNDLMARNKLLRQFTLNQKLHQPTY